jgi:two-component system, sensor histidine kinase and response regulator
MNQVLDMSVVDELLALSDDGDPELLLDLIQLFLADGPAKVKSVVDGLAKQDFEQMERAAHALKGSAGNLGARLLQQVCENMQLATRRHELAEAKQLTPQLETQFAAARTALEMLQKRYAGSGA